MRFLDKIARFWQECTTFEKIYCVAFTVTSIAISIIQDASFISALASITGMWCVFLVAKGNLNNFYFGAVFLTLSGIIMWQYGLYITLAIHVWLLFAHAMGWLLVLETLTAVVPNTP